jgi:hypothetical protein
MCLLIARVSVIFRDLHKIGCTLAVGSIAKSHQAKYILPNKRTNKSARSPSCIKFCTLASKICYYRCIAQLLILYRWHHQSQKLWIKFSLHGRHLLGATAIQYEQLFRYLWSGIHQETDSLSIDTLEMQKCPFIILHIWTRPEPVPAKENVVF